MVYDHFQDRFPKTITNPATSITFAPQPAPAVDIEELRQLIKDFREAVEAAKKVDALTNQPDCVDPEKAKLEERVAALEKQIAQLTKRKRK